MKVKYVGLCGPAGVGKDTAADALQAAVLAHHEALGHVQCPTLVVKRSWAALLKEMLQVAGIFEPERALKEKNLEGKSYSYRSAAQLLGTEWGRRLDPDIWVDRECEKMTSYLEGIFTGQWFSKVIVVYTDTRFENEAEKLRSFGGLLLHLEGRDYTIGGVEGHASTTALQRKERDLVYLNSGTVEDIKVFWTKLLQEGAL